MVSRTGQEIRLKQYPKGMPTEDIFELAKVNAKENDSPNSSFAGENH
jgi:hypothetical protein